MADQIRVTTDDFEISITDKRVGDWNSLVDAVVALIMAHEPDKYDLDAHIRFYDQVIAALAIHYGQDIPDAESLSLREIVNYMLDDCATLKSSMLSERFRYEHC